MVVLHTLQGHWPAVLAALPADLDLEATARQTKALVRHRKVKTAPDLLRLALGYGLADLSLAQTAAWAQACGLACLSDVALLKRLRSAADWLALLLGHLLRAAAPTPLPASGRLTLTDATAISAPGSRGTDWRVHLGLDLASLSITELELTDVSGGESLSRLTAHPEELVIADRGYAKRPGLWALRHQGAHFLVRLSWQAIPLQTPAGETFDLFAFLRGIPAGQVGEADVQTAADEKRHIPSLRCRLIALHQDEQARTRVLKRLRRHQTRKQRPRTDPRTLESAGYLVLLCSVLDDLSPADLVDLYRFRWQVELLFKRLKSLLHLDALPAKESRLARCFLLAKLLGALLIESWRRQLSFPP